MSINFNLPVEDRQLKPRITVIGIGGAGGNAVNNMIECGLEGVEFVASNTDAQALEQSIAQRKIQLGPSLTQGLGAGSRPDIGRAAAEEAIDELLGQLTGTHMVFLAAGMGGGTGTGAAPVIARAAKEQDILTVGVVTKPFNFEGVTRMRTAEQGIEELQQFVDTLIVIPNQNLFRVANEKTTFAEAFSMADDVLQAGVRGITDLMVKPGLINLDFADIRAVMAEMGKAQMGTGECEGENRAINAAEAAISNPILEDSSMKGARGVLINITGGPDMTMFEVDEAANRIKEEVDAEANIIFGTAIDESMAGLMRVSMVATGIDAEEAVGNKPRRLEEDVRAFLTPPDASIGGNAQADTRRAVANAVAALDSRNGPALDINPVAARMSHGHSTPTGRESISASSDPSGRPETAQRAVSPTAENAPPQANKQPQSSLALNMQDWPEVRESEKSQEPKTESRPPKARVSLFKKITRAHTLDEGVGNSRDIAAAAAREGLSAFQPPAAHEQKTNEEDLLEIPAFLRRQAN